MVEGNIPSAEWQTYSLQQLDTAINNARQAGKYLFIWDKQGSVGTFLQYKGKMAALAPEVLKVALGRQTNDDVSEFIRKAFVNGMRQGERLCFDLETATPNWHDYTKEGTFVPQQFFNYEFFNQEANYMPYVREDENHGIGGVNPGRGYIRSENFAMIIRCGHTEESEMQEVISKIPLFNEQFHHVII